MERAQNCRSPSISRRNNRTRRFRNEAPAHPPFEAEDRLTDDHPAASNDNFPCSPHHAQARLAFNPNDEEPAELSPNTTFIFTLYEMLNDDSLRDFIRWNEAGDAFIIPNIDEFKRSALGKYFYGSFDSFVRQLNGYSFKKAERSKTIGTYKHRGNKFLRDYPHLLHEIKRTNPHPERPLQQSQPASNIDTPASSNAAGPMSQPRVQLDLEPGVYDPEQENLLLRRKLHEHEEAYKNLESRHLNLEIRHTELEIRHTELEIRHTELEIRHTELEIRHTELEKRHENQERRLSEMEATVRNLMGMPQNGLPLRHSTSPEANGDTYTTTPSTSLNQAGIAQTTHPAATVAHEHTAHIAHIAITDVTCIAAFGNQTTPGGVRPPPGDGLFSHTHQAMPATVLPPPNQPLNVDPSSPPNVDESSVRQDFDSFPWSLIATQEQYDQGSFPESCHQMAIDDGTCNMASIQYNVTTAFTSPSRGSPRPLRTPTAVVHRKGPRNPTTDQDHGATSSYASRSWSFLNGNW